MNNKQIYLLWTQGPAQYPAVIAALEACDGPRRYKIIEKIVEAKERAREFVELGVQSGSPRLASALLWEVAKVTRPWSARALTLALRSAYLSQRVLAFTQLARIEDPSSEAAMVEALLDPGKVLHSKLFALKAETHERPAGEALQAELLKDLDACAPVIWVADYFAAHGRAHAVAPLLALARTACYSRRTLNAIEKILEREVQALADDLLLQLAALDTLRNQEYVPSNDDPDDLSTTLADQGLCDPASIRELAETELSRRRA